MPDPHLVTALIRPRCRMPLGEPDENGANWPGVPQLPVPESSYYADYYALPAPPKTEVRALAGADALYIRFDCALDDPTRLTPRHANAPLQEIEKAWVNIYPRNDPVERYRFEADFKGMCDVLHQFTMPGECSLGAVPDLWQTTRKDPVEWSRFHGMRRTGWHVEMVIPWASMGLAATPATIGLEYGRVYVTDRKHPQLNDVAWPAPKRKSNCTLCLEPGEALIGPDAGAPARLEIKPRYGKNRGRLTLGDQWPKSADRLHVCTVSGDGKVIAESDLSIPPHADSAEFDFWLDRLLCSHLDVFGPQRLVIEAQRSRDGQVLYAARLPMDRHLGICIDEPFAEHGVIEPLPGRRLTRREELLDRVTRALPRLERRTTAQGAPSDFCLMDEDGSLAVNLVADDAWQRMAALIEARFSLSEERIIGAMALAGQKSVTNLILGHMFFSPDGELTYAHGSLHDKMGPLSILRYGGGPAVSRAAVLARLLQQVRDPDSGRFFTTRVVSLLKAGGPQRAGRDEPFWQKTGPVGAVAVEYAADHTLLDPTALAAFVKDDGKLATLNEIAADERVRAEGAGRLAEVYAKLNAAEIRRERPNRMLSKGVFPELFPDEDRPDRPFDPRERQVLRAITAPEGQASNTLAGFRDVFEQRGTRDGSICAEWNGNGLRVTIEVHGVSLPALTGVDRDAEQVHLALDTAHDHVNLYRCMAGASGDRKLWRERIANIQTLFKHLSTEIVEFSTEITDRSWHAEFRPTPGGYTVLFDVPWKLIGVRNIPPVIGVNAWIEGRAPYYEQIFLDPPRWHTAQDPFRFADLYLDHAPVTLSEIDFGIPGWGQNMGRATLVNNSATELEITVGAENHLAMRRCLRRCPPVTAVVPAHGSRTLDFAFYVSPEEKMGGPQKIVLRARRADKEFFRGQWSIGYCGPLSAYQRYGAAVGKAKNPAPGAKNFLEKKIHYICSRIPQFRRLTTRDGAASDFVLRAEDASVEFNLMEAGVLDRMGAYVAGRFDNDLDRILGICYLSHAPGVARHMSWGHRIVEGSDTLSLIRSNFAGGGGNCGFHSRVFGGMAAHLKLAGKRLVAFGSVPVWGHVISAVARRGSKSLMDADVGHIFMLPDGSDLATLADFRANPEVLTTAGAGEIGRYYTVSDVAVQARGSMFSEQAAGVFPPGGPQA